MRVFITSTPDELKPHQLAAVDVARELGHEPVLRDPVARRGLDPVTACSRQVALADAVLAIVGWRRGRVPPVTLGGDGLRPWSYWEARSAFEHEVPVVALLAGEAFAPDLREEAPEAHAVVADLRGELARLAAVFEEEDDFRRLARVQLVEAERAAEASGTPPPALQGALQLRRHPPPELPTRPYPLLLPYSNPDLMAGRDDDLADLRRILDRPITVVGLHAASGTGKSSLLAGGLVPMLRAEGRPVAFERHPAEAGLAARLLGDLVETGDDGVPSDVRPGLTPWANKSRPKGSVALRAHVLRSAASEALWAAPVSPGREPWADFVDRLMAIRRLADDTPSVLVIDQFEDVLKDGAEAARAALGMLLAASAQRLPGTGDPPCRWLLAYRQEYHGKLASWLEDVLCDARDAALEGIDTLPHDLSGPARFVAFPLRPLATPPAESDDPTEASTRVFLDAIEKPLGVRAFPWRFAPGHAERLAHAFAEARLRQPKAPLVPELQVLLAHLLEQAGEPTRGELMVVTVPEEPAELIDRALEDHLRRALDCAFPPGPRTLTPNPSPRGRGGPKDARVARTRALLALRELADAQGHRDEGRPITDLARAIGRDGHGVLEKLATAQTRLVLLERPEQGEQQVYVLAHDRMAEVIVRLVDDEGAYAGLGVDAELLGLWRFVALQRQLFISGEVEQSTEVPKEHFSGIERHTDALLWDEEGRRWWAACRERQRLDRRRKVVRRTVQAAVLVLLTLLVGVRTDLHVKHNALLDTIADGEPEVAFAALARLSDGLDGSDADAEALRDQVRQRERPFDVLERGLGGVKEDRGPALLRVAELLLPLIAEDPKDPVRIASTVWALDFFAGPDPALQDQAIALRDEILGPLRTSRPPPPLPNPDDPDWADIPAGTFWMGAGPDDGRDAPNMQDEKPRHQVTLSAFRMMTHEVTNAEYRRLVPDYPYLGQDDLPAVRVTWYEAYTYAGWRGGRLPTESEWEYAARAGCAHAYCKRDGTEATLDEVAW